MFFNFIYGGSLNNTMRIKLYYNVNIIEIINFKKMCIDLYI